MADRTMLQDAQIKIAEESGMVKLYPQGSWRLARLAAVERQKTKQRPEKIVVNGRELAEIDTAGALLLFSRFAGGARSVQFEELRPEHQSILDLVLKNLQPLPNLSRPQFSMLQKLGAAVYTIGATTLAILAFVGRSFLEIVRGLRNPRALRFKEFIAQLELCGIDAIPVVAMMMFLVGVVIAYLFASQIEKYGANIFIVDGVGLAICRELSPVIVAIILAGRSGSAFTAQIGTMKLNEEIDALSVLGLSPYQVLVIPRFFALVISLPLLVFLGDVVGIFGGMLVALVQLGIKMPTFLDRLQDVLPLQSYILGLVKAPVFAAFIAVIGCRMGFTVENNARSIGMNTTSTVVQSIVAVILLNAAFAVIFVEIGI